MDIIELKTFVKNFRLASIDPAKGKLKFYLEDRTKKVKQVQSNRNISDEQMRKAIKEQAFISSIVDLDTEYDNFMTSVENVLAKALYQYEDYILNGAKLREQNQFLRERLEIMDKRELEYLEILKNKQ